MIKLEGVKDALDVVDDQRGQPTWTADLADRLVRLGQAASAGAVPAGIYHGTSGGQTTWFGFTREIWPKHFSVKESVFPFVKFPGVDTVLGPEMKSTGEVMGIDSDFGRAYAKAQIEAGNPIPKGGRALVSLRREDRARLVDALREIVAGGFALVATPGTARDIQAMGLPVEVAPKVGQGEPDVVQLIEAGEIDLVFNTVSSEPQAARDSFAIRRAALNRGLPYFTTLAALRAAAGAIRATRLGTIGVRALQEIHPNS
jgi:carbamoyl-phosphate synthase large subunit